MLRLIACSVTQPSQRINPKQRASLWGRHVGGTRSPHHTGLVLAGLFSKCKPDRSVVEMKISQSWTAQYPLLSRCPPASCQVIISPTGWFFIKDQKNKIWIQYEIIKHVTTAASTFGANVLWSPCVYSITFGWRDTPAEDKQRGIEGLILCNVPHHEYDSYSPDSHINEVSWEPTAMFLLKLQAS